MGKIIRRAYGLLILFFIIVFILSANFTGETLRNFSFQTAPSVLQPVKTETPDLNTRIMTFEFDDVYPDSSVIFRSVHQEISVTIDNQTLYTLETGDRLWTQTTGPKWNFIKLPQDAKKMEITFKAIYPAARTVNNIIYQGNSVEYLENMVRDSMSEFIISILDIVVGLIMVTYWFFFYSKMRRSEKSILNLGFFSIVVGIWTFLQTNMVIAVYPQTSVCSLAGFLAIFLWIVPIIQFVKEYYESRFGFIADVISIASLLASLTSVLLHLCGIAGMKQTVFTTHILMFVGGAYFIYSLFDFVKRNSNKRKVRINIIATSILLLSTICEFTLYYTNTLQSAFALRARLGLLLYISIICFESVRETVEEREQWRKDQLYKELVNIDTLTGCYSRYAYLQWEKEHAHDESAALFNMDLNNLKECNDTLGHETGDKYIKDSAALIAKTFGDIGKCYRIGGDEFVVGTDKKLTENEINELLCRFQTLQDEYNKTSTFHMQIAIGYAKYDETKDTKLENTMSRADARMYANKLETKKTN